MFSRMANDTSSLPNEIVQSIAISNAKSIGEQPAILANLALANQIFTDNLQQQMLLSQQQAMNQVMLAIVSKCVSVIASDTPRDPQMIQELVSLLKTLQPTAIPHPQPNPTTMASTDPLNQTLAETVPVSGITPLKSLNEQSAMLSNLAYSNVIANTNLSQQNAVANQQAMNELGISIVGKMVNTVANLGPLEARSAVDVLTDNELAQTIADLKAAVQAFSAKAPAPAAPAAASST